MHNTRVNKYKQIRKNQWLEVNSIRKNETYVITLLDRYGFKIGENCEIICDAWGDYGISLTYLGKGYRIEVDSEAMEYSLLGYNTALNLTKKNKYHCIKTFNGNDILIEVLNFLKNVNKGVLGNGKRYNING